MEDSELAAAVTALVNLKAEHRELLLAVASDPGMDPANRRMLLEHALEEEDEKLARIAALVRGGAAGGGEERRGLTVGSLRGERPAGPGLGNLRPGPQTRGQGR